MEQELIVLGDYKETIPDEKLISSSYAEYNAEELLKYWRRCSISSDFFAKFYSLSFPEQKQAENFINREMIESSISFLLNELFENAAKYSKTREKLVIFHSWYLKNYFIFSIENYLNKNEVEGFSNIVKEILSGNPEELYIQRLERNAETGESGSGLGYLTLMNDYDITFGYKFEKVKNSDTLYKVIVQAHLNLEGVK